MRRSTLGLKYLGQLYLRDNTQQIGQSERKESIQSVNAINDNGDHSNGTYPSKQQEE
jgi:hypothetical protein